MVDFTEHLFSFLFTISLLIVVQMKVGARENGQIAQAWKRERCGASVLKRIQGNKDMTNDGGCLSPRILYFRDFNSIQREREQDWIPVRDYLSNKGQRCHVCLPLLSSSLFPPPFLHPPFFLCLSPFIPFFSSTLISLMSDERDWAFIGWTYTFHICRGLFGYYPSLLTHNHLEFMRIILKLYIFKFHMVKKIVFL